MKVTGTRLESAPTLVRQLEEMECGEHDELPEANLRVGQDGSVEASLNIPCCLRFRAAAQDAIDAHNEHRR